MDLGKVGSVVILLFMCGSLQNGGYGKSFNLLFEEWLDRKTFAPALPNLIYFGLQVNITASDLNNLQVLLSIFNFTIPVPISDSITGIKKTAYFFGQSMGQYQCMCEESFAWSYDSCINHQVCSAIVVNMCGCGTDFPADDQYCQQNHSQTGLTNFTCYELQGDVATSDLKSLQELLRIIPIRFPIPISINDSMTSIASVSKTLYVCYMAQNMTRYECRCQENFGWSYDSCINHGVCNTIVGNSAGCSNDFPVDDQYCHPIINQTDISVQEKNFSFSLNLDFDPSFNNESSLVYRNINDAIQTQCKKHISTLVAAQFQNFRSGSTIATYTVTAAILDEAEIEALQTGLLKELQSKYPVIFNSETPLKFDPPEVFFEQKMMVTCGPPPADLDFGTNWIAEWRLDSAVIHEDALHRFSSQDGAAILTITRFFSTDEGPYECSLIRANNSVFRQSGTSSSKFRPQIHVSPVRKLVKCEERNVTLTCSVYSNDTVQFLNVSSEGTGSVITYQFPVPDNCPNKEMEFICQTQTTPVFEKEIILVFTNEEFICSDNDFGNGTLGFKAAASCEQNKEGEKTAVCKANGQFENRQDNCVLLPIQLLLNQSEILNENNLPKFLDNLGNVTLNLSTDVVKSPCSMRALCEILNNIANTTSSLNIWINKASMKNILTTAGVLITEEAKGSWDILNADGTANVSETSTERVNSLTLFLQSLETITSHLANDSFSIDTSLILLNKTTFTDAFNGEFNSSVKVDIPESDGRNKSITVITFSSMDNVLPARDEANSSSDVINGRVVLIQSSGEITNISITFDTLNDTLGNPKCVFWNFSLFDGLGGWDDEGCSLVFNENEAVSCNCNHLTSFSILMSPDSPDNPFLDYITYIGVGISIVSLVICLIIEAVIWRKITNNSTSYLRHVSIVNITVCLLIADIWFIIEPVVSDADKKDPSACSAAVFFIHFFYLALFFWMLASALLLLYRILSVFDGGLSKRSMKAIGFSLGYGAPLIIAVITVAVTAPRKEYIRENVVCWLNWDESRALLAFVIPALLIVLINFIILLVVIYKMLRRKVGEDKTHAAERHSLVILTRSLAVLTPVFGLTWILGFGTMVTPNPSNWIHFAFAVFNSLQGFFILMFGILLDKRILSELMPRREKKGQSDGTSSTTRYGNFKRKQNLRDGYNTSSDATHP